MRSSTSLRTVSTVRSLVACRLFFTSRAANPAVSRPSSKVARASVSHTSATSSAQSTLRITICMFSQRLGILPNSAKSTGPVQFSDPMVRATARQTGKAFFMKSKTKIWFGVGAFMVAGVNGVAAETPALDQSSSTIALTRALGVTDVSAAKRGGGEGGEHGEHGAKKTKRRQGGEGGEGGEGGAKGANLPPDLDFALKIAQIRGHLLVGDELVKEGQWAAALPHFLHPSEELYGPIRGRLKNYNTPQFSSALKLLATVVKQKKGGEDYANARKQVEDALTAADA